MNYFDWCVSNVIQNWLAPVSFKLGGNNRAMVFEGLIVNYLSNATF